MQAPHLLAVVQTAVYPSSNNRNTHSIVHQVSPGKLLMAIFEEVDCSSTRALHYRPAALCSKLVIPSFEECQRRHGDEGDEKILRATLQMIHTRCLSSPALAAARLSSTSACASGALLLVDLHNASCTVANVGLTSCLLAGVSGSFNSKRSDSRFLTTLHTTANPVERLRASRHSTTATTARIPLRQPTFWSNAVEQQQQQSEDTEEVLLTRAIGALPPKNGNSKYELEVSVSQCPIPPGDGHLILASSAFYDLLGPSAITLRAHLFEKARHCVAIFATL